jgi:hypothetical protein
MAALQLSKRKLNTGFSLFLKKKQVLPGVLVSVRGQRIWGKGAGGRMWWKYVLMYENGKMRTVETIPGMG